VENLSGISGYAASTLVLFTFVAKDMRVLRTIAIFSNLAFITYGTIEWLPPVLFLHMVLLPLNIVRLAEIVRATRATGALTNTDGLAAGSLGQRKSITPSKLSISAVGGLPGPCKDRGHRLMLTRRAAPSPL